MSLSTQQQQFLYILGTEILAPMGFGPEDPAVPGLLREAAKNARIHKEQGTEALHAHLDAIEAQDKKKYEHVVEVGVGAAALGIAVGFSTLQEVVDVLEASAKLLEEDFPPVLSSI